MEKMIQNIVDQKDICLICLTEVLEYSFSTSNTLLWLGGDEENCITIGDLMCYLLKKERHYYADMIMCSECTRNAIISYKFMLQCESNEKIQQKLLIGLKKITDMTTGGLTNQDKAAYMQIDSKNMKFNAFCDTQVNQSLSITLDRFKSILDSVSNDEIKQENDDESSDSQEETDNSSEYDPNECNYNSDTEKKTFRCYICSKSFRSQGSVNNHVDSMHRPKIIQCNICDRKYSTPRLLRAHNRKSHIKQTCHICGKMMGNPYNMRDHIKSHSMTLQCEKCLRKFTSNLALLKHKRRDYCNKPLIERQTYNCKECDARFSRETTLKNHIEFKHKGIARFICEICSVKCRTKSQLDLHVRRSHTGSKPSFPCSECEKVFFTKYYFHAHMRMAHTGEVATRCYHCDDVFSCTQQRTTHILAVHREKTFRCELCNVSFVTMSRLTKHRKSKRCKGKTSKKSNVLDDK